jgi:hypothetical protein
MIRFLPAGACVLNLGFTSEIFDQWEPATCISLNQSLADSFAIGPDIINEEPLLDRLIQDSPSYRRARYRAHVPDAIQALALALVRAGADDEISTAAPVARLAVA